MKTYIEKAAVLELRAKGYGYKKISKQTGFSRDAIRGILVNKPRQNPLKRGPKFLLGKSHKLKIKRCIARLNGLKEKANCTKIISECELQVSPSTVQRHLHAIGMKYKRAKNVIHLSAKDMKCRVDNISQWFASNHSWESTVFTDEKWFSLDGPNDWRSYAPKSTTLFRARRQARGGGIMVWMSVLPNGLLSYRLLHKTYKAHDYIDLLSKSAVPIAALNLGTSFCFQQDNAPIHRSKLTKEFFNRSSIRTLNWPPRSPDLNIAENVWKMLSDIVYNRRQSTNKQNLVDAINGAFMEINMNRRDDVIHLYGSFRRRLCEVLRNKGKLCNY